MRMKPYVPDFGKAFDHFCIHPGGKAVIEEVSFHAQRSMCYPHASYNCQACFKVFKGLAHKALCKLCLLCPLHSACAGQCMLLGHLAHHLRIRSQHMLLGHDTPKCRKEWGGH